MKKKMLSLCLALLLILSANMIVLISATPAGRVYVDPPRVEFSSDPTQPNYRAVGDTFTVNVSAADFVAPGAYAYQFKLYYDNTILEATEVVLPPGHFLTPSLAPGNIFVTELKVYHDLGYVSAAVTLMADEPGKTGSGTLVTITFKITKAPPTAGKLSCNLELRDVIFADPDIKSIEVTLQHGYYEYVAPMPPLPYLKIVPGFAVAKEIGEPVVINVTVQELVADWKAVGFQWKLVFDTSLLQVLEVAEGDFLKNIAAAAGPDYGTYFYAIQEEDYVVSFSLYYKYPWPPVVFPAGSGTLATITFTTTAAGSCDLTLTDVLIVDVNANLLETRPHQSGKYAFAPPWLSLAPKEYTADELNKLFNISVLINDVSAAWRMVGVEFKIRYNTTLLNIATDEEGMPLIIQGGFMKHFATRSGTDTWFQVYVEEDLVSKYGIVGIMILPLENGTWPGPFPDTTDYGAPGDLAIVEFKAIYQLDREDVTDEKAIWLDEIILANTEVVEIPYDPVKTAAEGKCKYTIKRAVPPWVWIENGVDLFTQYDEPFAGVGLNTTSDAFPPQAVVSLIAYAKYHNDSVPYKPVAYELTAPNGEKFYGTAITNEEGYAFFNFSLPGAKTYFGVWTVKAEVPLGGTVYSDVLYFIEDWIVKAWKIEAPNIAYKINNITQVTVYTARICMQDPRKIMNTILKTPANEPITDSDLLLHLTVTDEVSQVIAAAPEIKITFGEIYKDIFKGFNADTLKDYWTKYNTDPQSLPAEMRQSFSLGFQIPIWAFSGVATIHANVFTDYPGVAYCPEKTTTIWIKKSV